MKLMMFPAILDILKTWSALMLQMRINGNMNSKESML